MRKLVINGLLAALMLSVSLPAQMSRAPGISISRGVTSFGVHANPHGAFPHGSPVGAVYLGSPYWFGDGPSSYSPTPSVIVVQPSVAPAASASPVEEPKLPNPVMIEWQGDRYVRRTESSATARNSQPDYVAEARPRSIDKRPDKAQPQTGPSHAPQLPPATLVFRDGHREQSNDYSIIAGVIYTRGDFWTDGYWSKQIPVSQLDVPATLKANEERGVTFRLPSAPNEVITRP